MRVAFSGSHRTGKTTLIAELSNLLPAYELIDEPYRVLEEDGHEMSDPPSIEDYELQLRTSIDLLADAPANALLDRCPLDFLAYIHALDDDYEVDEWLDGIRDAMARLDLVVFVPIGSPDRITIPHHEDRQLRRRVDERLHHLLVDDPFSFEFTLLEVSGAVPDRIRQALAALAP